MNPAPYIPQQPLTIIDTMSAASDYATDHDASSEGTPSPPPGLVTFTGFSPGGKPDLRLDTSSCASKSPVFESALPGIDSEPPTPATNSSPSTESELLTPSSSKPELSPIYTSSASFNVPLYATSSRLHASAQSQDAFHSDSPLSPASLTAPAFTDHSPNQGPNRLRPEPNFRFPSVAPAGAPIARCGVDLSHSGSPPPSASSPRVKITHPYARLYAKNSKEAGAAKRRRMWNHALEKSFFTPQELSSMGAPQRRTIYTASLETHIDQLHCQLEEYNLIQVQPEQLEPYRGLNSKTAKSMVAGLQKDMSDMKLKALELERSNHGLRGWIMAHAGSSSVPHFPQAAATSAHAALARRHSVDASLMSHLNLGM